MAKWQRGEKPTIQGGIHPTNIHQETDHGHIQRRSPLTKQLITQDFAGLSTLRHRIDIDVGKSLASLLGIDVGEDLLFVLKDCLEKLVLNIRPPQRDPVLFLDVLHLVPPVDGRRRSTMCVFPTTPSWRERMGVDLGCFDEDGFQRGM